MIAVWVAIMLGYVVLQVRLMYRLADRWREVAGLPLLVTVPALMLSISGFIERNEYWAFPLVCGIPLGLLGLVSVWGIYWAYGDPSRPDA